MKSNIVKLGLRAVAFLVIFCTILSFLTLIYLPKRTHMEETGQPRGFYEEPENTIDVLFLGSCNMYSSISPVLLYEEYGITGYAFCCPDQEMSTSYTYLKEALKHQDLKAVVVESLFVTERNNKKREAYDRFVFDYFPLNANKLKLGLETAKRESEIMSQYDPTTPDALLTYAGMVFPLLRYHSRTDLTADDVTYFFENDLYNPYKGGFPQYNYTTNDGLFWDRVFNGDEVNEMALKYIPMMKELCDEAGIPMIIAKSPNFARWGYDDTHTKIVRDFAAELNIPFLDYHRPENFNYEISDYGYQTGRLNIYGVQKFTKTMGKYLTEEVGLAPTELSEEDKKAWDECVEWYYDTAEDNNCSIYPGQLAELRNLDGALRVRWNECEDAKTYSVYRCEGKDGESEFELLTDEATGHIYDDSDVENDHGYTYYVVPNEGEKAGEASKTKYWYYLDMPKNFTAVNDDGKVQLTWEPVDGTTNYWIQRRYGSDFNFRFYDSTKSTSYTNGDVIDGNLHYYRLTAVHNADGVKYQSMSSVVWCIPQHTPEITQIADQDGVKLTWKALTDQDEIRVYRRAADEESFSLLTTLGGDKKTYTDTTAEPGKEYYYQIKSYAAVFSRSAESETSNTVSVKVSEK